MIAANELRIGNWVMYDNRLFQIEAISRSLPCLNTDEFGIGVVDWNNIQPIELSPEILEKCGLKRHSYEMSGCEVWYLQDTSWRVARSYRDENEYKLWHERISPPTWNLKTFAYLHELQNIIFALTNTELNYAP